MLLRSTLHISWMRNYLKKFFIILMIKIVLKTAPLNERCRIATWMKPRDQTSYDVWWFQYKRKRIRATITHLHVWFHSNTLWILDSLHTRIEKGFCCSGESTRLLFHEMCESVVVLSVHARLHLLSYYINSIYT